MNFFYTLCLLLFSFPFFVPVNASAQTSPSAFFDVSPSLSYKFRVYLRDKGETAYSLDDPTRFLSPKAIERKERQGVKVDEMDLPISQDYFTLVEQAGGKVVTYSKWLNTLVVELNDSLAVSRIESLSFVDSVKYVWRGVDRPHRGGLRPRLGDPSKVDFLLVDSLCGGAPYGMTQDQFKMHNAQYMIDSGYRGKGIQVGVIDAGFTNFDVIPWFDSVDLRGFKDFVPGGEIFSASDHGTKVLSTMAIDRPGIMMGSAPDASYWLLRSEDVNSEFPVEEDYWVASIEYADSAGVDVVNTSLGYNHFNDTSLNYTHDDLTGRVSVMSQAADLAFRKGMIVVVSAGNEGNKAWQKSTPPGDAMDVLAVGAVGTDSVIASFSSRGEMADGRVKPDLVSVGRKTVTVGQDGLIQFTNGTSLSSPFLAGLIASLWSINPELHRSELIDVVKHSSDRFFSPDPIYGYGIPDFQIAMREVLKTLPTHDKRAVDERCLIEPDKKGGYWVKVLNPAFSGEAYRVRVLDESGHLLSECTLTRTMDFSLDDSDAIYIPLSKAVRKENTHLYFMVEEPFKQRTYRIRL